MEDTENVKITRRDTRRYLSSKDYNDLEGMDEFLRQGKKFAPWAGNLYDKLVGKVEAHVMSRNYTNQIRYDALNLKELLEGEVVSTSQEAIKYFVSERPDLEEIFNVLDPKAWFPEALPKIREAAENCAEHMFQFIMGDMKYPEIHGIDTLEFGLDPYAVITISVSIVQHKKTFKNWIFEYPAHKKPLFSFTDIRGPSDLDLSLPNINLPLELLRGLSSGDLQPSGCEITKQEETSLSYRIVGFDQEVVLPNDFITFIMSLGGEDPLSRLQELGLLGEMTFRILASKKEEKPLVLPVIREKDEEQLRIIAEAGSRSSWGGVGGGPGYVPARG
ncbi:hypothetical protein ES703_35581 [subsurface metagenome]